MSRIPSDGRMEKLVVVVVLLGSVEQNRYDRSEFTVRMSSTRCGYLSGMV